VLGAARAPRARRIDTPGVERYPAPLFPRLAGRASGLAIAFPPQPEFALERTLVLLKPDAVQRGLIGKILGRFEDKGLKVVGLKLRQFEKSLLEKHYGAHRERPFFNNLVKFMGSGPVVALALEGKDAIEVTRKLMGKTNARQAEPGTIRGDLGMSFSNNLVHGSDGPEAAKTELALFFPDAGELVAWESSNLGWIYSVEEELR
jgi:nucleoside-diphosphate kinase